MNDSKNLKFLNYFVGIFLCLLSCILIINSGYLARTLAFPLLYFLGFGDYVIYILLFFLGMLFLLRKNGKKIKYKSVKIGIIILFFSILFLITQIIVFSSPTSLNFFDEYNVRFFSIEKGYYNTPFYDKFSTNIGGGLISYLFTGIFNAWMGRGGTLAVIIIITLIGLLLLIFPLIKKMLKGKEVNEKKSKKESKKEISDDSDDVIIQSDVFKNASSQSFNEDHSIITKPFEPKPIEYNEANEGKNSDINEKFKNSIDLLGTMKPAVFRLSEEEHVEKNVNESKSEKDEAIIFEEPKFVNINENNLENDENTEMPDDKKKDESNDSNKKDPFEHHEQVKIDFDAKPEFNNDLLNAKNEFIEPEVIKQKVVKEEKVEEVIEEEKPKEKLPWIPPSTDLLNSYAIQDALEKNTAVANERMDLINNMFASHKVGAKCVGFTIGPSITRFNIDYDNDALVKNVSNIVQDISRILNGVSVRFEPTVPGSSYSGLEIPNAQSTIVSFKDCVEALPDVSTKPYNVPFGKDITGNVIYADFAEFPHLLVSGTTGSGKSVFVNSLIATLIMRLSPDDLKLAMVDPKQVEMMRYTDIPHLLCPIITEANTAKAFLDKLVIEMNSRYSLFVKKYVTNVKTYNEAIEEEGGEKLPRILVILDEYADLAENCKDITSPVTLLAAKARAAGIHLLIATQRPTVNIITGTIKANINTRVSLSAASIQDSLTILDEGGAEKLLGNGDMLVKSPLISRTGPLRLQGCLVKDNEVAHIIGYLKNHYPSNYDERFMNLDQEATLSANELIGSGALTAKMANNEEERYETIKEWSASMEFVSMSKIQREFGMGFNHAGKVMKRLQNDGIVATTTDNPSRGYKVIDTSARHYQGNDIPTSDEQMIK